MSDRRRSGHPLADRRAAHAEALAKNGDPVAAADLMSQALELAPDWMLGRMRLGAFLQAAGRREEAVAAFRAVLAADPADPLGAELTLAQLGVAPVPDAAPAAFVAELFDTYAAEFDDALVHRLAYVVPDALLALVREAAGEEVRVDAALDLGCGTGLMGERLRPLTKRLVGIDLSFGMLEKARRKGLYDALVQGNVADPSIVPAERFDLVAAADVLIYLGDLAPVFALVAARLAPRALFAFSVEADETAQPFRLLPSSRYAHAPAAVARRLGEAGLELVASRRLVIRLDRNEPVDGLVAVARARPGGP